MTAGKNAICSWSGGKDSCFALIKAIEEGFTPQVLLNVLNEEGQISRSHGIPAPVLQAQAHSINLPIHLISSSWQEYERNFVLALGQLKTVYQTQYAIFGDIDLQAHRDWEEMVCEKTAHKAVLPLWQQNRKQLVIEMLEVGIKTIIISCNTTMGPAFLGREITQELIGELEVLGVDACGENGEYHTLVLDCPLFNEPIHIKPVDKILHENYWFLQIELDKAHQ